MTTVIFIVLFLNGVGILVVGLGHAFPLAVELEQKQEISEIYASAPPLFKHADHGHGFLDGQYIDACLEIVAGTHGIDIVVELPDGAMLQFIVNPLKDRCRHLQKPVPTPVSYPDCIHSIFLNWSLPTPQRGHTQSSGISSNFVPGAIPLSGSPIAGS